jgi:hypothetical protein
MVGGHEFDFHTLGGGAEVLDRLLRRPHRSHLDGDNNDGTM